MAEIWAALGSARGIARSASVDAGMSALHVFGIALLVGPIRFVDLRVIGRLGALEAAAVSALRWTARIGVGLVLVTGVLRAWTRTAEDLVKPVFLATMVGAALALATAPVFAWRACVMLDGRALSVDRVGGLDGRCAVDDGVAARVGAGALDCVCVRGRVRAARS